MIRGRLTDCDAFGVIVEEATCDIRMAERKLSISNLYGEFSEGGSLRGTIDGSFSDVATFDATLTGSQVDVSNFESLLNLGSGDFDLDCKASVPWGSLSDWKTWSAEGRIQSGKFTIEDQNLSNVAAAFMVRDGIVDLNSFFAELHGGSIKADGQIPLAGPDHARVDFQLANLQVDAILSGDLASSSTTTQFIRQRLELSGNQNALIDANGYVAVDPKEWNDVQAWRAATRVTSQLAFNENSASLKGLIGIENGDAVFRDLSLQFDPQRQVSVNGRMPVSLKGGCNIRVKATQFPISTVVEFAGNDDWSLDGSFSADANLQGRLNGSDVSQLVGTGRVQSNSLEILGKNGFSMSNELQCRNGTLALTTIVRHESTPDLAIEGKLDLRDAFPFEVELDLPSTKVDLSRFVADGTSSSAEVSLNGRVSGDLMQKQLAFDGGIFANHIRTDQSDLGAASFQFKCPKGSREIACHGELFDGTIDGTARLDEERTTISECRIATSSMDIGPLVKLLRPKLQSSIGGRISSSISFRHGDVWRNSKAEFELTSSDLTLGNSRVADLLARMEVKNRNADYQLSAKAFDGEIKMNGTADLDSDLAEIRFPMDVGIKNWQLKQIAAAMPKLTRLKPIGGRIDSDMKLSWQPATSGLAGSGDLSVRALSWGGDMVSASIKSKATFAGDSVRLDGIAANVGGGKITGNAFFPWKDSKIGTYDLRVRGVPVNHRTLSYVPVARQLNGRLNARLIGRIGSRITGSGDIDVRRLTYKNRPFGNMHSPLRWSIRPETLDGELDLSHATLDFADGRLTGDAKVKFGRQFDFSSNVRIARLNTGKATYSLLGVRDLDQGRLNGTLSLQGRNVRSIRNVSGQFHGELLDTQVMQLPVLSDLTSFINAGQIAQGRYDSKDIDIRIRHGVVSIEGLPFHSANAELFVNGKIQENQRLNLNVVVQTGAIQSDFGLNQFLDSPIANLAAPGASALSRASEYLADRVIYVHVGGTVRRPVFRLRPGRQIVDQLLRYYLPQTQLRDSARFR